MVQLMQCTVLFEAHAKTKLACLESGSNLGSKAIAFMTHCDRPMPLTPRPTTRIHAESQPAKTRPAGPPPQALAETTSLLHVLRKISALRPARRHVQRVPLTLPQQPLLFL